MSITIKIIPVGALVSTDVNKKDFLEALKNSDGVNDIINIKGRQYTLSSADLGGAGITDYKIATLPLETNTPLYKDLVANKDIDPLRFPEIRGTIIKLADDTVVELDYIDAIMPDGTLIFEAYSIGGPLLFGGPVVGYWVALRPSATDKGKLEKIAELQMTDQFWAKWYRYVVKSDLITNQVKFVSHVDYVGGIDLAISYVTTLTLVGNVLSAVDTTPSAGMTYEELFNSLTGHVGAVYSDVIYPLFDGVDDWCGMLSGPEMGWIYIKTIFDADPLDSYRNIVGFNILTGASKVINAVAAFALVTNFELREPTSLDIAITAWVAHPLGVTFQLCDYFESDGSFETGLTGLWSPSWTDATKAVRIDYRDEFGRLFAIGGVGFYGQMHEFLKEYILFWAIRVSLKGTSNVVVYRKKLGSPDHSEYTYIPLDTLDVEMRSSFTSDLGIFFSYSSGFTGVRLLAWLSDESAGKAIQTNVNYPSNFVKKNIYEYYASTGINAYQILIDTYNKNVG